MTFEPAGISPIRDPYRLPAARKFMAFVTVCVVPATELRLGACEALPVEAVRPDAIQPVVPLYTTLSQPLLLPRYWTVVPSGITVMIRPFIPGFARKFMP